MKELHRILLCASFLSIFGAATANALPYPLTLSLTPRSPVPDQEITLTITFPEGVGWFAFGTTFAPEVSIQDLAIVLSIDVNPPSYMEPDTLTAPSFSLFEGAFSLGALPLGSYTLHVFVSDSAELIGSGSATFSVVPEPSTGLLVAVGFFVLAACLPARRCS